jgi:hypothetical protein
MLGVYPTVVRRGNAVYLSAPITTGRRYVEWRSSLSEEFDSKAPEQRAEHVRLVVKPNKAHVRELADELRHRYPVVIDPTSLEDVPEWTQADYRFFWGRVIEEFVHRVVFADGWHYSSGCVFEFWIALRSGRSLHNEGGQEISPSAGLTLVQEAFQEMERLGAGNGFFQAAVENLSTLVRKSV